MIKAELRNTITTSQEFPILMRLSDHDGEVVVLFSTESKGTVVFSSMNDWAIGDVENSWKFSDFSLYEGQLILQNGEK